MDRGGRDDRKGACAAKANAGLIPRRASSESLSAAGPVFFAAAEYYQEQEQGDLCYAGTPRRHMRVRCAVLTPERVILHDSHGRRIELAHDDPVTLIERAVEL